MLRSYKFLGSAVQLKLHELIIAFFNRIEHETEVFDNTFFGPELLELANKHPRILKQKCIDIYNQIRSWNQADKTNLCSQIRDSNQIKEICAGRLRPTLIDRHATGLSQLLRDLFIDLYDQVLDGNAFNEIYSTNLKKHFDEFSKLNSEITLCPICGIGELKKHTDTTRDQYDHYLPKAFYPLSSINFKNLVPICKECNSFDAKGGKDPIAVSTNNKLFFLYDETHKGIIVTFKLLVDSIIPENIVWQIIYINPDDMKDEVESWKTIYNIDSRYKGFVNARIEKWYRHYWEFMNDSDLVHLSEDDRRLTCFKAYEKDESLQLNFIRKPALIGFLTGSTLSQAAIEAKQYSIPPSA